MKTKFLSSETLIDLAHAKGVNTSVLVRKINARVWYGHETGKETFRVAIPWGSRFAVVKLHYPRDAFFSLKLFNVELDLDKQARGWKSTPSEILESSTIFPVVVSDALEIFNTVTDELHLWLNLSKAD